MTDTTQPPTNPADTVATDTAPPAYPAGQTPGRETVYTPSDEEE